ncbi:hypothetical protein [Oleiharenicola sp. Vm1]|uniref:hypothetical protein n=1 Tax=Oleiharenicola sp. Vm1 TaxID=3398393 RepID=UPI0039F5AA12
MTTFLPTTSPTDSFPGAAPSGPGSAPLADGLAALLAPASGTTPTLAAEFTALLDDSTLASASTAPTPTGLVGSATPATLPSDVPTAPRVLGSSRPPSANLPATETADTAPVLATDVRGLALTAPRAAEAREPERGAGERAESTEANPALPDRATLEAIVALLVPAALAANPEPSAPALGAAADRTAGAPMPETDGRPAAATATAPLRHPRR